MSANQSEPLIHTTDGNVPIASLKYETAWDVQDAYIKFTERHRNAAGVVVRESAHVFDKRGITAQAVAASLG